MSNFYIKKTENNFNDSLICYGLVEILSLIKNSNNELSFETINIKSTDSLYHITTSFNCFEFLDDLEFSQLFKYINKTNKKTGKVNEIVVSDEFDVVKKYNNLSKEEKKITSLEPNLKLNIIQKLSDKKMISAYLKTYNNWELLKPVFGDFVKILLEQFLECNFLKDDYEEINQFLKKKSIEIKKENNSLQDINPSHGKGVNKGKASGINLGGINIHWIKQTLAFIGYWTFSFPLNFVERKKMSKSYFTFVPEVTNIKFNDFSKLESFLRKKFIVTSKIKTSIELLLKSVNILLQITEFNTIKEKNYINQRIKGYNFAFYQNLGQQPAVTNIGFLGIPDFIGFSNKEEAEKWLIILEEHLSRINKIDEDNSNNVGMLQNYRDFFSAGSFDNFFEFTYDYADFIMSSLNDKKYYIEPFTKQNMEELVKTQTAFSKILENKGFLAIAEAIRNSTIIPISHNNKKDVIFGLSQKFNIASRTSESLLNLVTEFIQKYNESVMLKDYHNQVHKKYVTTEEFAEFCKLLDEGYSSKTISGMLVAYGYSKEQKKENNTEGKDETN